MNLPRDPENISAFRLIIAFCVANLFCALVRAIAIALQVAGLPFGGILSSLGKGLALFQFPTVVLGGMSVSVAAKRYDINLIGGCLPRLSDQYGFSDRLCTEWKLSLAFTLLAFITLLLTLLSYLMGYPDRFSGWSRNFRHRRVTRRLAIHRPQRPPPRPPAPYPLPAPRQDSVTTPSEPEVVYEIPAAGPNTIENYQQQADYLVQAVHRPGMGADDTAAFPWPTSSNARAGERPQGSLVPLAYGERHPLSTDS